jgi:O-antigen ligase
VVLPAALTLVLAFRAGGYFPGETAVAAAVAISAASAVLLLKRPAPLKTKWLALPAGAMLCFGTWALLSAVWSPTPAPAVTEGMRVFLYLGILVLAASLTLPRERRWLLRLLTTSMVVVGTAAFVARALPGFLPFAVDLDAFGLNYPITYANALGLLMAAAIVLCFFLTTAEDEPLPAQALAAAAIPVLSSTLALTLSRGAAIGCFTALAAYMLVSSSRAFLPGLFATLPAALLALAATLDAELLATSDATSSGAVEQAHFVAFMVIFSAANAGALRTLLPRTASGRLTGASFPLWGRLAFVAVVTALGLAFLITVAVPPDSETSARLPDGAAESLESRSHYWRAAFRGFEDQPLTGVGAGAFPSVWAEQGMTPGGARDAHSLYVEVLAELGGVGAVLLAIALISILLALARLAWARSDPAYGAMLAVGLLWTATAAFEWTWEMPAATLWFFAVGGLALGDA